MASKYRLAAFDLDGTLLQVKSSWQWIHRYFGTQEAGKRALKLYVNGKISYDEFMGRDIAAWPLPVHLTEIDRVLSQCSLQPEAEQVVKAVRRRGSKIAIITSGLDLLASRVAQQLGVDYVVANGLGTDRLGYLNGLGINRVEPLKKHRVLARLSRRIGVPLPRTLAIGDTLFDRSFLRTAGLGLVFRNEKMANRVGLPLVRRLSEILRYL